MKTDDAHGPNQLPRGAASEDLFEAIGGQPDRRELIDGAQMKVRPIWMQKLRRDIRKAWADTAEQDDDGES